MLKLNDPTVTKRADERHLFDAPDHKGKTDLIGFQNLAHTTINVGNDNQR